MRNIFIHNLRSRVLVTVLLTSFLLLSACTWFSYKKGEQVTFPNNEYKEYIHEITGASYGWKFLCFFAMSTPNYAESLDKIWGKSEIPISERNRYKIVNLTENWGTSWSVILIGQNYLKLTGDIVESKK